MSDRKHQELIDRQEDLLKQTDEQAKTLKTLKALERSYGQPLPFNQNILRELELENMPPPPQSNDNQTLRPLINTQNNMAEQEALRYILGQLMLDADQALGEIPENMGLAEREMRGSSEALGKNDPGSSVPHQEKALEYLKEAQEQLSQQLMARMKQLTGIRMSGGGMRYDPLGRPYGEKGGTNPFPGQEVEIPSEAEQKRAHEILRLLRRRAGEQNRPREELQYYRRLLRRF